MRCSHPSCLCEVSAAEAAVQRDGKPYCSEPCAQAATLSAEDVEACRCRHPECADREKARKPVAGAA